MSYHKAAWLPRAAVEAAAAPKVRNFLARAAEGGAGGAEGAGDERLVDGVDAQWLVPDRVIERCARAPCLWGLCIGVCVFYV